MPVNPRFTSPPGDAIGLQRQGSIVGGVPSSADACFMRLSTNARVFLNLMTAAEAKRFFPHSISFINWNGEGLPVQLK